MAARADDSAAAKAANALLHGLLDRNGKGDSDSSNLLPLRNAGTIEGQVVGVDYRTGVLNVQTAKSRYDVRVLPSTNIQAGDKAAGFRTIADIARGSHVQILMSQRGSEYIAQLIRLR